MFSAFATDLIVVIVSIRVTREMSSSKDHPLPAIVQPLIGCDAYHGSVDLKQTLPAWAGVIFFDTVLFVLTFIKAYQSWKLVPSSHLFTVLLRDGFIFYTIMLTLNISNLALYTLPLTRGVLASSLSPVLRANFSIIGSRLILNIRGACIGRQNTDEMSVEASMQFVGSVGDSQCC